MYSSRDLPYFAIFQSHGWNMLSPSIVNFSLSKAYFVRPLCRTWDDETGIIHHGVELASPDSGSRNDSELTNAARVAIALASTIRSFLHRHSLLAIWIPSYLIIIWHSTAELDYVPWLVRRRQEPGAWLDCNGPALFSVCGIYGLEVVMRVKAVVPLNFVSCLRASAYTFMWVKLNGAGQPASTCSLKHAT